MKSPGTRCHQSAFSLVELLVVLAVIGILAAIVISNMSNAAHDSRRIIARQQQVVLQGAINNWVAQSCTTSSLSAVRTSYNNAADSLARLALVQAYLDPDTYLHFTGNTSDGNKIQSDAMKRAGKWVELPAWSADSYPQVDLQPIN